MWKNVNHVLNSKDCRIIMKLIKLPPHVTHMESERNLLLQRQEVWYVYKTWRFIAVFSLWPIYNHKVAGWIFSTVFALHLYRPLASSPRNSRFYIYVILCLQEMKHYHPATLRNRLARERTAMRYIATIGLGKQFTRSIAHGWLFR